MFADFHKTIRKIPKGRVSTYGAIAYVSGHPGCARQVVWALRAVARLPWHRVIGAGGKILLPGEQGFEQRMRLRSEGVSFIGQRVDMKAHEHNFFARRTKPGNANTRQKLKKKAAAKRRPNR